MKLIPTVACSLLMCAAGATTHPAMAADNTPSVRWVQARIEHDIARFAVQFARPSNAWAGRYDQPRGWTTELLMVPSAGPAGLEYQVDGALLHGGALPVFRFENAEPFVLQCPDGLTPRVGAAQAKFALTGLDVALPFTGVQDNGRGAAYELQVYSLVPVDSTELVVVVRFDLVARFRGTLGNGHFMNAQAMLPTPSATTPPRTAVMSIASLRAATAPPGKTGATSWGVIKDHYR